MKKALLLLIISSILISCKKDRTATTTERITGRWLVEYLADVDYENGAEKKRETYPGQGQFCDFRSDGTATVNLDGEQLEVRWTATDTKLTFSVPDRNSVDFVIRSSTGNTLILEANENIEVQGNVTYRSVVEIKMTK